MRPAPTYALSLGSSLSATVPASGVSMYPGQYIMTRNGTNYCQFMASGNLCCFANARNNASISYMYGCVLSTQNTTFAGLAATLAVQTNGTIVAATSSGKVLWSVGAPPSRSRVPRSVSAVLRIDYTRNLCLYSSRNTYPIWCMNPASMVFSPNWAGYMGSALIAPSILYPGQFLISPNKQFACLLQTDGTFGCYQSVSNSSTITIAIAAVAAVTGSMTASVSTATALYLSYNLYNASTAALSTGPVSIRQDGNMIAYASDGKTVRWKSSVVSSKN